MPDSKDPTHNAIAMKRLSKTRFISLEIGKGRQDSDGVFHAFIDRLPVGGFTGYVYFAPTGKEPPAPEPQRPDDTGEDEET